MYAYSYQKNISIHVINTRRPRIELTLGKLPDPPLSRDLLLVDLCVSVMATSRDDIKLEGKLICEILKKQLNGNRYLKQWYTKE